MHSLQTSKTGAAAILRYGRKSPLQVWFGLRENDPTANLKVLLRRYRKETENDDDIMDAIWFYVATNFDEMWRRSQIKPKTKKADVGGDRKKIIAALAKLSPLLMLNAVMPDGRRMKEWTFSEIGKLGGIYRLLATKGRPSQRVGDVLTDDDLKNLK